jgi:hypothetical protein
MTNRYPVVLNGENLEELQPSDRLDASQTLEWSQPFVVTPQRITLDFTIPSGMTAQTTGPIEAAPEITVRGLGSAVWRGI